MRLNHSVLAITAVSILLAGSTLLGCSKSTSPTYGGGGGGVMGGGAGNTPFNSGALNAGGSFTHTFPTAGAVGYHCNFHGSMGMVGTVTVVAGAPASVTVTGSGTSFTPSAVSVAPGGQVRWNIGDGGPHTVTSD